MSDVGTRISNLGCRMALTSFRICVSILSEGNSTFIKPFDKTGFSCFILPSTKPHRFFENLTLVHYVESRFTIIIVIQS